MSSAARSVRLPTFINKLTQGAVKLRPAAPTFSPSSGPVVARFLRSPSKRVSTARAASSLDFRAVRSLLRPDAGYFHQRLTSQTCSTGRGGAVKGWG